MRSYAHDAQTRLLYRITFRAGIVNVRCSLFVLFVLKINYWYILQFSHYIAALKTVFQYAFV